MTKQELMETYAAEQLADMVVALEIALHDKKNTEKIIKQYNSKNIRGQCLEHKYSLTDEEYKFLEEHFNKPELLWKYKRTLEEADEEKGEKFKYTNLYLELEKAFEDAKKERDCQIAEYQKKIEKLQQDLDRHKTAAKYSEEYVDSLKKDLDRSKNIINQIDDILEKLFGVRHDSTDKPDEFEKILSKNAKGNMTDFLPTEPIKVADMLINAEREYERNLPAKALYKEDKGTYRIFNVGELRQIAEHLLVYCNHHGEVEE